MNQDIYQSPIYKKARAAYMMQSTFEYFVSLLVADAFLAKLLSSIGISDAVVGIISSFISMAFVFQLASIFMVRSKLSAKSLVLIFDTTSQLFFMFIYLVPFLPVPETVKKTLVVISILIAYAGKYLITSIFYKWANSYVDPSKRASYAANREILSLISGIVFTAMIGWVIDRFESIGNLNGSFLFIAVSMLLINICNFISLTQIKKDGKKEREEESRKFALVIRGTLGNRSFRQVIYLTVLHNVATYFTTGFMGVFKTKDLMLSVFAVQIINMVGNICRILVSRPLGRYSDKKSFAKGFELALYFSAVALLANVFTTPRHWYLIVVSTIFSNISYAGTNQNIFNITYSYIDKAYITQAMALKSSIGGICGFGASLIAGKILNVIQANGNTFLGIPMYAQQLLSLISFLIVVLTIIFLHFVIAKQKVRVQ